MLAVSDRYLQYSCFVFALSVLDLLVVIVCFHAVALWPNGTLYNRTGSSMAVLDEQTALARIIRSGWRVAKSQEISITALGPDPALSHLPQQQLWDAAAGMPSSPVPSRTCGWGYTDMLNSPAPLLSACSATPVWAHPDVKGAAAAPHKPSSAHPARRCLCADLSSTASATAAAQPGPGSPLRDSMIPAVRACPGEML